MTDAKSFAIVFKNWSLRMNDKFAQSAIPPFQGRAGGGYEYGQTLLLVILFLLPWQTRWIFSMPLLHGGVWEYGIGSLYAVEVLILIAALFSDWKKIGEIVKPLKRPIGIFVAVFCLSAMFGSDPVVSWGALTHVILAVLLALMITTSAIPRPRLAAAFVLGLIPAGMLGWFQVLTASSPSSKWFGLAAHLAVTPGVAVVETSAGRLLRAYGTFPHPNIFGGYLAMGILMTLWLGSRHPSFSKRVWGWFVLALFLSATLIITFSRSAMLGLLFGLICFFVLHRSTFKKNLAVLGMVFGLVLSATWFHSALLVRADAMDRLEQISVNERVSQYGEFWDVFNVSPLLGTGTSAYTKTLGDIFPDRPAFDLQPIHNVFLLFLAEQGIAGVMALGFGLWALAKKTHALALRSTLYALPLLPLALVDHYLWSSWSGLALLALLFALLAKPDRLPA